MTMDNDGRDSWFFEFKNNFKTYLVGSHWFFWRKEAHKNGLFHFHLIGTKEVMQLMYDTRVKWWNSFEVPDGWLSDYPPSSPKSVHLSPCDCESAILSYTSAHAGKNKGYQSNIIGRAWGLVGEKYCPLAPDDEVEFADGQVGKLVARALRRGFRVKVLHPAAPFGFVHRTFGGSRVFLKKANQNRLRAWAEKEAFAVHRRAVHAESLVTALYEPSPTLSSGLPDNDLGAAFEAEAAAGAAFIRLSGRKGFEDKKKRPALRFDGKGGVESDHACLAPVPPVERETVSSDCRRKKRPGMRKTPKSPPQRETVITLPI
jgi:hypothetical protein